MSAYGFFPHDYFAGTYFPAVWFAPVIDETPVIDEIKPGGTRRRQVTALPGWYTPKNPPIPARRLQDEEEAMLICIGAL